MTDLDLDRWLATELMGWQETWNGDDQQGYEAYIGSNPGEFIAVTEWHPSQFIAQAFQCVEKMRERGWDLRLDYPTIPDDCLASFCRINGDTLENHDAIDPNPALAIVKAIFNAFEVVVVGH